ncbi:hypothetical protein M6D93_17760 [Jatrophihabitans telluris]|uniref:Phage tail protein n=1 Tax=Jatrophihabitans telluris TaxID=2038343 RepID=A0ABY4QZ44_9ACTN|nr:hypothetical protein [Jatrophihabitans telluris]UQX88119.1 hypothetical protein M6D93_17760 [Jatrophihabitans telluris]
MSYDPDGLLHLLPRLYQRRDVEAGGALQALLEVVAEQVEIVDADIAQLYDDWFIETCQPWVIPYLGELIGYRSLPGSEQALASPSAEAALLANVVAPRRDVANTVRNRRRRATLAVLEDLAADVARWPARSVEFLRLLEETVPVRLEPAAHSPTARAARPRTADLRRGEQLDRVDGPFDELAHTVAVSRLTSHRRRREFNLPEVGLFLWRLQPYSITRAPAYCVDRDRAHFTLSLLGNDVPLITAPRHEPAPDHIADETNVPAFIRRRAFHDFLAQYYGPHRSLALWLDDELVDLSRIVPADLSGWRYHPSGDQVAVDPVRGRIALPVRTSPDVGVWVSYHYGLSDDLGGGEYERPLTDAAADVALYRVGPHQPFELITDAVRSWQQDKAADPTKRHAVIEITDSGAYQERIRIELDHGDVLTVRAAQRRRPVLRMLDWYGNRPDALTVVGTGNGNGPEPQLILDGLLVGGRGVRVRGDLCRLVVRHSTFVPGWSLDSDCCAEHEEEPSLELFDSSVCVQIEHSILGSILVNSGERGRAPATIYLSDSVLDATRTDLDALGGPECTSAYAAFNARRSTIIGVVRAHSSDLLDNSILDGEVVIEGRQDGCVRFCWLPPDSQTPPRFHCEPELSGEPERVRPVFTDTRYGTPGYLQLDAAHCPREISRGADDASEMGVFHDLFQPQRTDALQTRVAEYIPAGGDAGLIFVT